MEIPSSATIPPQSAVGAKHERSQELDDRRRATDSVQERRDAERSGGTRDSSGEASASDVGDRDRPPERSDNDRPPPVQVKPVGGLGRSVDVHV